MTRKKKEDPHVASCLCEQCEQRDLRKANTRLKETCDRLQKNLTDMRDAHDAHAKKMAVHLQQLQAVNEQLNEKIRRDSGRADRLQKLLEMHADVTEAQLGMLIACLETEDRLKG